MNHDRDESIHKQLREAARVEYKKEIRDELKDIDERLKAATTKFLTSLNSADMTQLNSLWSRAVYLLGIASGPAVDPGGMGGRMRAAA